MPALTILSRPRHPVSDAAAPGVKERSTQTVRPDIAESGRTIRVGRARRAKAELNGTFSSASRIETDQSKQLAAAVLR
jgi:hypothetical protein